MNPLLNNTTADMANYYASVGRVTEEDLIEWVAIANPKLLAIEWHVAKGEREVIPGFTTICPYLYSTLKQDIEL